MKEFYDLISQIPFQLKHKKWILKLNIILNRSKTLKYLLIMSELKIILYVGIINVIFKAFFPIEFMTLA